MLQRPGTRAVRLRSRGLPASSSARWCRGSPVLSRSEGAPSDSAAVFQLREKAEAEPRRVRWPLWWPSGKGHRSSARQPCGATPRSWITAGPQCQRCRGPRPASSVSPAFTASSSTCSPPSCSPCS